MIKIVEGDILESNAQYIVHQTNCVSHKASGLAKFLFEKFPHANVYEERALVKSWHIPGQIYIRGGISSGDESNRLVINVMGQFLPGAPQTVNMEGIEIKETESMRRKYFLTCLSRIMEIKDLKSIAFPWKIGCGLAKGNWKDYNKILNAFAKRIDADVSIIKRSIDD